MPAAKKRKAPIDSGSDNDYEDSKSDFDSEEERAEPNNGLINTVQTTPEYERADTPEEKSLEIYMEAEDSNIRGRRLEMERRRDQFLLVNAVHYLNLLPSDNFVNNLIRRNSIAPRIVYEYKLLTQPSLIKNGTMKHYQLETLSFLVYQYENGMSSILASEMGLGKSMNTLSLFAYLNESYGITNHLIICPLSVLSAWMTELKRWTPHFKTLRFHGPASERNRLKANYLQGGKPDVVVTTYEAYCAEANFFKQQRWSVVVLDEGHKIKNHESQVAIACQGITASMRLILSGTPLQNNLVELWALLHFLCPVVFEKETIISFKQAFNLSLGVYDQTFLKKSQALLELIMIRRTKENVKSELSVPSRNEMTLYVPLSPAQRFWYLRLLNRSDSVTISEIFQDVKEEENILSTREGSEEDGDQVIKANVRSAIEAGKSATAGNNEWSKMMNLLMQLRKTCNHPYLLPNAETEPFEVAEHLVAASSKLVLLDKLLGQVLVKGEKVLIFSGFTRMLDILEDFMNLRKFKYARLDGSTSRPRRTLDIKLFQQANSPLQVFLISTRAGGLGINLTAASTVVLFDQDWNPQVDIQAISRAHRIGQTKIVQVYRLVCQDSVEEQALTRLRKKLYLSAKVMGTMKDITQKVEEVESKTTEEDDAPRMTRGELSAILRGGAGALARWGTNGTDAFSEFRKLTFDELCERGKDRDANKEVGIKVGAGESVSEEDIQKLALEEEAAERILLAGREAVQTRSFEGAVHKQSNTDIAEEWNEIARGSRGDKRRVIQIDGVDVDRESTFCMNGEAVRTITSDPEMLKKLQNAKRQRAKFDHEDWCTVCRDGGDVYQCSSCPRACHGPCSGYSEEALEAMMSYFCSHHTCHPCGRTTQEAGGLLFRCQTCEFAYCEDCLGSDDIESIGDVLPEFLLLGMGRRAQAYFIRCGECCAQLKNEPNSPFSLRVKADELETQAKMKEAGLEI